jgi:hypothetical protein
MTCENKVSYHVARGYGYREVFVKCGNTDPHGNRAICEKCRNNASEMEAIERHEENVAADNAWLKSAGWGEM